MALTEPKPPPPVANDDSPAAGMLPWVDRLCRLGLGPLYPGFRDLWEVFFYAGCKWGDDAAPRHAAAISFYASVSMAPTAVLAVFAGGYFFGERTARAGILEQASEALGPQVSQYLDTLITNAQRPTDTIVATVVSLVIMLGGSANLFLNLKDSVNAIWGIKGDPNIWKQAFINRVIAWLLTVVFSMVVLTWLAVDSIFGWLRQHADLPYPQMASNLLSFAFLLFVFAASYRGLPGQRCTWKDVWLGAIVAALGVSLTRYLLSLYFGLSGVSAVYGGAGALVIILLWIYYTNWVYLYGMELVYAWTHLRGSRRHIGMG